MMKQPNNWNDVKPAAERQQLPKGGYVCKIMDAKVVTYGQAPDSFEKLEISLDISDGEFKDFYAADYRAQTQEDKRWKGVLRQYIPKDDGSEKDEWTKSSLKALTDAVEESNPGYHWNWDESSLKGKAVGCLFRSEEWEFNGREGWATRPFKPVAADNIKSGKFKIPADKPLKNKAQPLPNTYEEIADSDLPF